MRIEKFVHSCLRLTLDGKRLLFDPGKFSFVDGRVDPRDLSDVDFILFTHGHPDHFDCEALRTIVGDGEPRIFGGNKVAATLRSQGFTVSEVGEEGLDLGPFTVRALPVRHEPILAEEIPAVLAFVVNDRLLNPGDSFDERLHQFAGIEALALPVMAPFLTEIGAYEFASSMRPSHVLPVHDGYARDWFLTQRYDTYEPYFEKAGMTFHRLQQPGDGFDL